MNVTPIDAIVKSRPLTLSASAFCDVVITASEVRLDPATVHAGDVYFVVEGPDDPAEHAGFTFTQSLHVDAIAIVHAEEQEILDKNRASPAMQVKVRCLSS